MALSNELISQFVAITAKPTPAKKESTVYGTMVKYDGATYVKIDGSDMLTPVSSTTDANDGERVTVMIKDHTATVTGNMSSPSARTDDVKDVSAKISQYEIIIADKVNTSDLEAERARIDSLAADNVVINQTLSANTADISQLETDNVTINEKLTANEASIESLTTTKLDAEIADLKYATIEGLTATDADIYNLKATYATVVALEAARAQIDALTTDKLSANEAELKYVAIDYSNIDQAWMNEFYAKSGLVESVTASDMTVTDYLVGVTIKGDIIEANTIVADSLKILGDDGLYYKLNTNGMTIETEQTEHNSLDGSVIAVKSVAATKIKVEDLVAFGATIGGFVITDNSIHSYMKDSVSNPLKGIYFDNDGQMYLGDSTNYIKFYVDEETGVYKLAISADSVLFSSTNTDVEALTDRIKMGTYTDEDTGEEEPSIEISESDSDFKQVITNTKTMYMEGPIVHTTIDAEGITTKNIAVENEIRQGGFAWTVRPNGNYALIWKGESN